MSGASAAERRDSDIRQQLARCVASPRTVRRALVGGNFQPLLSSTQRCCGTVGYPLIAATLRLRSLATKAQVKRSHNPLAVGSGPARPTIT